MLNAFPVPDRLRDRLKTAGVAILTAAAALGAAGQTNPPPASYVRSYVNDLPDQPLVTVTVTGVVNVACFTIEEILPAPASAQAINGGGVWLPSVGAVRWGPFTNTTAVTVSYRLTGPPGSYPVNGGAWMDGQWFFSPAVTLVTVLPSGGGSAPAPPPQVTMPLFTPAGGAVAPTNVAISCATTGAMVHYTLDGSVPTAASFLYTGPVAITQAVVLRARGFAAGYAPSVVRSDHYSLPSAGPGLTVARSIDTNTPGGPLIQLQLAPTNAGCFTLEEPLPRLLIASNVTAGGAFDETNRVVRWGPFFGTNTVVASYQAVGPGGTYGLQARWSVDGAGGGEAAGTNIFLPLQGAEVPTPPLRVATPVFAPAGGMAPTNVTLSCATPGAVIYYSVDGSVPTTSSLLYTGSIAVASPATLRARAFTNGWTPSVAVAAHFGVAAAPADIQVVRMVSTNSPETPTVQFNLFPGPNAACLTLTEQLPPTITVTNVTAGGQYLVPGRAVRWGPFFGTNAQTLSYQASGPSGIHPVQAAWSVDGIGGGEAAGTNLNIVASTGSVPAPPLRVPTPVLTPAATSGLPVAVSISCSDGQAQIYFTTDGSLPAENSALYTGPLAIGTRTSLRARAFRSGYEPSVAAAGEYVATPTGNALLLTRSVAGNGTAVPDVAVTATPQGNLNCYVVSETVPPGLTPSGVETNAVWNPANRTIRWGPFFDNQQRGVDYALSGQSGTYSAAGQGSFDGFPAVVTGAGTVTVNAGFSGAPDTSHLGCVEPFTYHVNINPAPGIILVTSASGSVDWGDGTQSAVTAPVMTLQKQYAQAGTYTITLSADWSGTWDPPGRRPSTPPPPGHATRTDTIQVLAACDPPFIVTQPSNRIVLLGTTVQFSVNATSYFPIFYQWYFNHTNPIVGPGGATLTLTDVRPEAAGVYSVLVTNAYAGVTSAPGALTVITPLIQQISRNQDGSVTLQFAGLPNSTNRLWAASNLAPPVFWEPLTTNQNTGSNGVWLFVDTNAPAHPARYYRFSTP